MPEATVNRATFCSHYTDKFDRFNVLIASDFQKLLDERNVRFDGSRVSGLAGVFLAICDYFQQVYRDQVACARQASSGPLMDASL
jgi:AcrR family transcriptional regulator